MNLAQRLLAVHNALDVADIEHAVGGAIALAYWTEEPRGTRDIDINVFVDPGQAHQVLEALPEGVAHDDQSITTIKRDGQVRLWWEETPLDLFFSNLPIHDEAAQHRKHVPFEGQSIPVLGPLELALFKAMFDRTRDWADIEEMLAARSFDPAALEELIVEHAGDADSRLERLRTAASRAQSR